MFFSKRKKKAQPKPQIKAVSFEKAFEERLGQDPTTYVLNKMVGGSDIGAIRNLFDIMAAEIELRSRCKSPGFDYYYEKALSQQILKPVIMSDAHVQITKSFAISQLIGKERFLDQYGSQLKTLAENGDFMSFVAVLRQQLAGQETTNTREANKRIADYFYINKANERFSEVKAIVEAVLTYGKQASAHISIYYAMFLYEQYSL
jgi:hypothetical protein